MYGYDTVGNLETILDPPGGLTEMDYDEVDRSTERRLPNSAVTTWSYDLRGRSLSLVHEDRRARCWPRSPTSGDVSGDPTKITPEDGSYVDIDYDAAWRVEEER